MSEAGRAGPPRPARSAGPANFVPSTVVVVALRPAPPGQARWVEQDEERDTGKAKVPEVKMS